MKLRLNLKRFLLLQPECYRVNLFCDLEGPQVLVVQLHGGTP